MQLIPRVSLLRNFERIVYRAQPDSVKGGPRRGQGPVASVNKRTATFFCPQCPLNTYPQWIVSLAIRVYFRCTQRRYLSPRPPECLAYTSARDKYRRFLNNRLIFDPRYFIEKYTNIHWSVHGKKLVVSLKENPDLYRMISDAFCIQVLRTNMSRFLKNRLIFDLGYFSVKYASTHWLVHGKKLYNSCVERKSWSLFVIECTLLQIFFCNCNLSSTEYLDLINFNLNFCLYHFRGNIWKVIVYIRNFLRYEFVVEIGNGVKRKVRFVYE